MKTVITARHFEASTGLKAHIEDSLDDMDKYIDRVQSCDVILRVEKYRNQAEIVINSNIRKFVSEATADDMRFAFDSSLEKLKTQLRRHKEKTKSHKGEERLDTSEKEEEEQFDNPL